MIDLLVAITGAVIALLPFMGASLREGPERPYLRLTRIGKLQVGLAVAIPLMMLGGYFVKRADEARATAERAEMLWIAQNELKRALAKMAEPFAYLYLAHAPKRNAEGVPIAPFIDDLRSPESLALFERADLNQPMGPMFQEPDRPWRDIFARRWREGVSEFDLAFQKHGAVLGPREHFIAAALRQDSLFQTLSRLGDEPVFYRTQGADGGVQQVLPLDLLAYAYHDRMKRGEPSNFLQALPDGGTAPMVMDMSNVADLLSDMSNLVKALNAEPPQ